MLKINDVTINIQFDFSIGEKRLLELVNACVSHEMRNPINAIFGMNLKMRGLVQSFFEFLAARNGLDQNEEAQDLKKQFEEAMQVKESAAKLLNFYVADLLCLAQIEKGTFRKNISSFDLREAIQEVITIQDEKAKSKNITLRQTLVGFDGDNFTVSTDKMRI